MIYYTLRAIVLALFILCFFFIKKHRTYKFKSTTSVNNIQNKGGLKTKRTKFKKAFPFIAVVLVFSIIISYPYEGYFIRFESLEKSLQYSIPDYPLIDMACVKDEDTYFAVCQKNNNNYFHSIVLYDDGYGLCDFKTSVDITNKQAYFKNDEHYVVLNLTSIYNKISDKTSANNENI